MPAEFITLSRDCEAVQIPSGNRIQLVKGTQGRITQSLGGAYTIVTDQGEMIRISGENGDAIGKPVVKGPKYDPNTPLDQLVWDQLKTCYDPEIPINIVELGLVYEMKITPVEMNQNRVDIKMTLTAPGCGMGEALKADAQSKILHLPGIKSVDIELVFEPVWDQSKMSEAAKLQLGL